MINLLQPCLGQLKPNQVHIWHVPLEALASYTTRLLPLLSEEERASYQRACQFQKYPPQLASRALLKLLLAYYVNADANTLTVIQGAHGKPSLQDYPWLQYSVSHTKTDIVFALTLNSRLGIDIETVRPLSDYLDLAKRFFSPAEYAALSLFSEHQRRPAFIKTWTVKEAFVKAVGFGLSYPLSDFTIAWADETPTIIDKATIKESSQAADWQCYIWPLFQDGFMALVTEGMQKQVFFDRLDVDSLVRIII